LFKIKINKLTTTLSGNIGNRKRRRENKAYRCRRRKTEKAVFRREFRGMVVFVGFRWFYEVVFLLFQKKIKKIKKEEDKLFYSI
jgi:hypothetical protein